MSTLDSMLERNKDFAARQSATGTPMPSLPQALPNVKAIIIGCADMRVDPAHVLGVKPGEAVVMRNIGGRITPATLRSWALLGRLGQGQPPAGMMVVLQHTDCGIRRLADYPEQLAEYFEIPVSDLAGKAVDDPYAAVRIDVDIARRTLPPSLLVSGLVYDVNTGLIDVVVPAATE